MMVCGNCGYTGDDNTYVCPACGAQMYYQDDNQYYSGYEQQDNYSQQQDSYGQAGYAYDQNQQYDEGYYDNNGYDSYNQYGDGYNQWQGQGQEQPAKQEQPPQQAAPAKPESKKLDLGLSIFKKGDSSLARKPHDSNVMGVTKDGRQFYIPGTNKKIKTTSNTTIVLVASVFAVIVFALVYIMSGNEEVQVISSFDAPAIVQALDNTLNAKSADFTINYNYARISGSFEVGDSTGTTKFYASSSDGEDTLVSGGYYTKLPDNTYSEIQKFDDEIGFELVKGGTLNKDGLIKKFNYGDMSTYTEFLKNLKEFANKLVTNESYMKDYIVTYEIVESTATMATYRLKVHLQSFCKEVNSVVGTKLNAGKYSDGISTVTITIDNNYITTFAMKANTGKGFNRLAVRLSNFNNTTVDVTRCKKIQDDAKAYIDSLGTSFSDGKHTSIFDRFSDYSPSYDDETETSEPAENPFDVPPTESGESGESDVSSDSGMDSPTSDIEPEIPAEENPENPEIPENPDSPENPEIPVTDDVSSEIPDEGGESEYVPDPMFP